MLPPNITKLTSRSFYNIFLFAFLFSCGQDDDLLSDFGSLELTISLDIERISTGRSQAVDTDNFKVTVFEEDGTEAIVFDPFSSVPNEVPLPVGRYYVVATSNNEQNAAFEEPFYYGETEVFTIDKEEEVSVTIDLSLANTQVSVIWSNNIVANFSDYTAIVTIIDSEDALTFTKDETRSGYFITSPLSIAVTLTYEKIDGEVIEKTLNRSIQNPLPKSHYKLHLDASLENGVIVFNLNVDEGVDVIELNIGEYNFQKIFGESSGHDAGHSIVQTSDGGYIMAGHVQMPAGSEVVNTDDEDYWVIKISSSGSLEWQKTLGGTSYDVANSIIETNDGGFALVGQSGSNNGDIASGNGGRDVWVVKLNITGGITWETSLGTSSNEFGEKIVETSDGELLVGGYSNGGNGYRDYLVYKLSSSGSTLWEKKLGGSDNDIFHTLGELSDGNYVIVGESSSTDGDNTSNKGGSDVWMLKLTSNGDIIWNKSYGGSQDESVSAAVISNGLISIVSQSYSYDGDLGNQHNYDDLWLITIDSDGAVISNQSVNFSAESAWANDINRTEDGGFILTGGTRNRDNGIWGPYNVWLLKIDAAASIEFEKSFNQSDYDIGYAVSQVDDGGYVLCGEVQSAHEIPNDNVIDYDALILKLNAQGSLQ